MPAFTKGEWKIGDTNCILGIPIFAEGSAFRVAILEGYVPKKENEANARLIAAAPELYSLLKSVVDGSAFEVDIHGHYIFTTKKADEFRNILKRIDGKEVSA